MCIKINFVSDNGNASCAITKMQIKNFYGIAIGQMLFWGILYSRDKTFQIKRAFFVLSLNNQKMIHCTHILLFFVQSSNLYFSMEIFYSIFKTHRNCRYLYIQQDASNDTDSLRVIFPQ